MLVFLFFIICGMIHCAFLETTNQRNKRTAAYDFQKDPSKKWPNPVPVTLDDSFSIQDRFIITQALVDIACKTCLRFDIDQHSKQHLYLKNMKLEIRESAPGRTNVCGTSEAFGRTIAPRQEIKLWCIDRRTVQQEVLYSLGLYRAMERPDRDTWLIVSDEAAAVFPKQRKALIYDRPYEYNSVMHYAGGANFVAAIRPIPVNTQKMSEGYSMTSNDAFIVQSAYCPGSSVRGINDQEICKSSACFEPDPEFCKRLADAGQCHDRSNIMALMSCQTTCKMGVCDPALQVKVASPPSSMVEIAGKVLDEIPECCKWALKGHCMSKKSFMVLNCPIACGTPYATLNNYTREVPRVAPVCCNTCQDRQPECVDWAALDQCRTNPFYMKVQCPHSCCSCGSSIEEIQKQLPAPTNGCRDTNSNCVYSAFSGQCNLSGSELFCCHSCKHAQQISDIIIGAIN